MVSGELEVVSVWTRLTVSRKPWPGMILQAVDEFGVDLARSALVGDKESDIQAGIAAGVGCNLLYLPSGSKAAIKTAATAVVASLVDAGKFLYKTLPA